MSEENRKLSGYTYCNDEGERWIGAPNNGGDIGDLQDTAELLNKLLGALHDAINSPQGVVPDSAKEFYQEAGVE